MNKIHIIQISILIASQIAPHSIFCQAGEAAEQQSFRDIKMTPPRDLTAENNGELRTDAQELAEILKIKPLVDRLRAEKRLGSSNRNDIPKPVQQARLICLWKILLASEEVRKVSAAIDSDLADANTSLEKLTAKRNNTINMLNTLNFMQGGTLGVVRQSMALHAGFVHPNHSEAHKLNAQGRQEIAITSFSTGTALALMNLLVPSLYKTKIGGEPNTLSYYLNLSYEPSDAKKNYLWQFLDSEVPGTQLKRRELLIRHWHDFAGLNDKDQVNLRRLSSAPSIGEDLSDSIRTLNLRITLLHDLKTHIEEFDGCLYELHQAITFI